MQRAAECLPRAFHNGEDKDARTGMSYASLLGGMALANAGLGVVHGFAAPIGGMFDAPHGAICAAMLPAGMRANIAALRERDPQGVAFARYGEVARILTGNRDATSEDGAEWIGRLTKKLAIPSAFSLWGWGSTRRNSPRKRAARTA